jgi:hypothetical protein
MLQTKLASAMRHCMSSRRLPIRSGGLADVGFSLSSLLRMKQEMSSLPT